MPQLEQVPSSLPAQAIPSRLPSTRSMIQVICATGAALVGLVLLWNYVVLNLLAGSSSPVAGLPSPMLEFMLAFIAIVGLLSILGAIGYWNGKAWGWYIHLISVLGQLAFPGALFEFKLDLYHMIAWASPPVSLVILIVMGIRIRRAKTNSKR